MDGEAVIQTKAVPERGTSSTEAVAHGNEAFNRAMFKEPPSPFSANPPVLYLALFIGALCSIMNGYEASLFNNLLETPHFKDYFQVKNSGIWTGIVSSMYEIGSFTAFPFIGPALDTFGRRFGLLIGILILFVGTVVQGTTAYTAQVGQFMGGRFLLGFGIAIAASAGPTYITEIAHPAYRGRLTALYNTFWFIGSIVSSGAVRGSLNLSGRAPWLLPTWLQIMCPAIIVGLVWLLPESPRWLYVHGRQPEAKDILVNFHGKGNKDSRWVTLQLNDFRDYLNNDGADKKWWDYRALFRSRSSIYRLACNCTISVFGQWAGNAVISYFLSAVLDTAGITDPLKQTDINVGLNCVSFVVAVIGAYYVDRVGRRPLLLFTNAGCCITWFAITLTTWRYDVTKSAASAKAFIAFVYIFGTIYAAGFNPLLVLYPVEVLSYEMRGKGMAFSYLTGGAANLLNQFAWPVALDKIGWKTYVCFIVWCAIQTVIIYYFIPETRNRTLEQLDEIFEDKNPVQRSLESRRVILDSDSEASEISLTDKGAV